MAKEPKLPPYAFAISAQLALVYDAEGGVVWEVTLTQPLVIENDMAHGVNHLPAGAVLYLPTGQMEVAMPRALQLASAASEEIAAGNAIGTLVDHNDILDEQEVPF